jgi:hypothetical protein
MTEQQISFLEIGANLPEAKEGQLFGKPCFKINGKAFVCFFQNEMVFKIKEDVHFEALSLPGSKLFDPSGKNRPMKEWVQVPFEHEALWQKFALEALDYCNPQ